MIHIHGRFMSSYSWGETKTSCQERGSKLAATAWYWGFGPFLSGFDSGSHGWTFLVLKVHGFPHRPVKARACGPGTRAGPGMGQVERHQGEGSTAQVMLPGFAQTCQG